MTKEEKKQIKALKTEEVHEFLKMLWDKMPKGIKKCNSCSGPVFGDFKPLYFDHLLEKEKYPQYSMVEENIWFCCGDCHYAKTSGFLREKHLEALKHAIELHKMGVMPENKDIW